MRQGTTSIPGIDPRVWLTLAVVEKVGYDPAGGVFADVTFQPTGEPETAYVAAPYAGNTAGIGFGAWFPLEVGDTVLVAVPGGDTGAGPVIVARFWNTGDPPPSPADLDWAAGALSLDPPSDVVIRAKPGSSFKIRTATADLDLQVEATGDLKLTNIGTGNITVETLGAGKVKLGVAATAQALAYAAPLQTGIQAAAAALSVAAGGITDTVLQAAVVTALQAIAAAVVATTKTEAT